MPAATMRRRMTPSRPSPAASLASLGAVLALALAACSTPGPSIVANSPVPLTPSPSAAPTTGPSPTPTPVAGSGFCDPAALSAQVTAWDSGAGHRNASVTLTNNGRTDCTIHALAKPQLLDGKAAVLIDGAAPTSTSVLTVPSYASVKTMVSAANYCGPATPVAPVTVAFVFPNAEGTVVAAALNPTDLSGVPPCNGPSLPGQIEMQPFAP
jgi:uncharacterized protein DUF4232